MVLIRSLVPMEQLISRTIFLNDGFFIGTEDIWKYLVRFSISKQDHHIGPNVTDFTEIHFVFANNQEAQIFFMAVKKSKLKRKFLGYQTTQILTRDFSGKYFKLGQVGAGLLGLFNCYCQMTTKRKAAQKEPEKKTNQTKNWCR